MFARALCGTGNGDHVVHGHHQVGHDDGLDGCKQLVAALDVVVIVVIGSNQLDTDPDQQDGTHDLQEGQGQQHHGEGDQDDAQDDGAGRAVNDALAALLRWQLAAGKRNHDGVIAAQQNVDDDDLAQRDPEGRMGEKVQVHVFFPRCRMLSQQV